MEDYSERNLHIIEEAMQELGVSDYEEIPEAIRLLKQKSVEQLRALDVCPSCAGEKQVIGEDGTVWVCGICGGTGAVR